MNFKLKEDKFHVRAYFAPCACKCKFCCLGEYRPSNMIAFEDYAKVMKKFSVVEKEYGMRLRSFIYNCAEHPYLKKQIELYDTLPMVRSEYTQLDLNGTRPKSESEISEWLDYLKNIGIEKVAFSWFGCCKQHDEFVSRNGYFDYLKNCATISKEKGILVKSKIFLYRSMLPNLEIVVKEISKLSDSTRFAFMEYTGNAKMMDDEFLTDSDLKSISSLADGYINPEYMEKFKSESEWTKMALNNNFPDFNIVDYILYIEPQNINYVLNERVEKIINDFRKMNIDFQNSIPDIKSLANEFGDVDSGIIYECRDVLRKWLDKYYSKYNLDKNQLFSFTNSSVEWKVYERL